MSGIYLSQQERSVQYTRLTWLTRVTRLNTRGGNWLQSQRPSARVYGDYSLIIAINSSFSVYNRTRSAAECHLYWILSSCPTCFPVVQGVSGRLVSIWWLVAGQFFLKGMNERYLAARRPMFDPPTDRPNLILFSNLAANCPNIKLGIKTLNHKSWNTPFPVFFFKFDFHPTV